MNVKNISADKKMLNIAHKNRGRAVNRSQPHIEQRRKKEGSTVMMVITHTLRQMAKRSKRDETKVKITKLPSSCTPSKGLCSTARGWRNANLKRNKGCRAQKTHLKRSHQPPGFALKPHKYKRRGKVLQLLSF